MFLIASYLTLSKYFYFKLIYFVFAFKSEKEKNILIYLFFLNLE